MMQIQNGLLLSLKRDFLFYNCFIEAQAIFIVANTTKHHVSETKENVYDKRFKACMRKVRGKIKK